VKVIVLFETMILKDFDEKKAMRALRTFILSPVCCDIHESKALSSRGETNGQTMCVPRW
jgi:hypothetical protein